MKLKPLKNTTEAGNLTLSI